MSQFEVILFDVGGVLLTNGWDRYERGEVFARFGIDKAEYDARQREHYVAWDTGQITAREFQDATIFYKPRTFSREEFWAAVLEQSELLPDGALGILEEIAASNKYLLGALNNEPRETNEYRFEKFGLNGLLRVRLSSCYLGLHKPDLPFYRRALDILGCPAEQVLFIDDRVENVAAATDVGIHALLFEGAEKLRRELEELGVLTPQR
ncbi:MAG: HAD-IA family hydrolase [Terracidiphilus sp.]|nr:HAD-IA family hydrolase [Terracidiphilus sp.]